VEEIEGPEIRLGLMTFRFMKKSPLWAFDNMIKYPIKVKGKEIGNSLSFPGGPAV
jgi:hypothetical protein